MSLTGALRVVASKGIGAMLDLLVPQFCKLSRISRGKEPYLDRYYPGPDSDTLGWYLHKFWSGDLGGEVHNHPWSWCLSIILTEGYREIRYLASRSERQGSRFFLTDRQDVTHLPFGVNILNSNDMHRVILLSKRPVWTLFIHGPRTSTWGFADEETGVFREILVRTRDRIQH